MKRQIQSTTSTASLAPQILPLVLGLVLALAPAARSALRTWDGSSSGNWSTAANWVENAAPVDGDDVVFPVANILGVRRATNNIIGLDLRSITFYGSNYWVYGQRVTLTEGLTAYHRTSENLVMFPITLEAAQAFRVNTTVSGWLSVSTNVNLNGYDLTLDSGVGELHLNGILSGTGNLRKEGGGEVLFGGPGPNTYVGSMTVAAGTLSLNKLTGPGITGAITNSGTIQYYRDNQISYQRVMLNAGSVLDLGNYDDTLGPLLMRGATARTLTGTLTLSGNISNYASSTISTIQGTLSLGSGNRVIHVDNGTAFPDLDLQANITGGSVGFTKTGDGTLYVRGTNTYNGFTYLADGTVHVYSDMPFGDPGSGVVVSNGGSIQLLHVNVTSTPLTFIPPVPGTAMMTASGNSSWAGPIILSNDVEIATGGTLTFSNAITGPGGITLNSATFEFAGTNGNSYAGDTIVRCDLLRLNKTGTGINVIAVPGNLFIGGTSDASNVVKHLDDNQIENTATVTLYSNAVLNLNGYTDGVEDVVLNGGRIDAGVGGQFRLYGNVTILDAATANRITGELYLLGGTREFYFDNSAGYPLLRIDAAVTGSGHFLITGAGMLELRANSTYTGLTTIDGPSVWVFEDAGLGSGSQGTVVEGGQLYVSAARIAGEPLILAASGGVPLYAGGTCTWGGPVTLTSNATVYASSSLVFSNAISGPGGITLRGDTFEYYGNATNTYSGVTTVECELLQLNHAAGDNYSIPGDLVIGGGPGASNVVKLLRCCQMPDTADVTVLTNGVLNLNGYDESLGGLTFEGGQVDAGIGPLTLNGNVQFLPSDRVAEITGQLSLRSSTRTFSVEDGPAYPSARIYANITGSGSTAGIIWKGVTPSVVMLRGTNSYPGLTTITNLRLYVYNSWSLGLTNYGTLVQDDGDLWLVSALITNEAVTLEDGASLLGNGTSLWAGPVVLAGNASLGGALNDFEIRGPISGAGDLLIDCTGVIRFSGNQANTYSGTANLRRGVLQLAKTISNGAIPGPLIVGSSSYAATNLHLAHNQIANAAAVTVEAGSLLDLNDFTDTIGPLAINGARVETGTGTLRLNGDVTVSNTDDDSVMRGIVDLWGAVRRFNVDSGVLFNTYASIIGSGDFVKEGTGWMLLRSSNNYSGLTLVADGILDAMTPFALGLTNNGTVVSNSATLYLSDNVTNESLTLNGPGESGHGALHCDTGTNVWTGPITLNGDCTVYVTSDTRRLDLLGPIGGSGGLTKNGGGPARLGGSVANSYAGLTRINAGTLELNKSVTDGAIPGNLYIGDGSGGDAADVARLLLAQQIANTSRITITNSGLLGLASSNDTVGSVSGSGQISLGSARLTTGDNDETTLFTGLISGIGGRLSKSGSGTFTITGNNSYSGVTLVTEGTLLVGGSQPSSPVQVNVMGTLQSTGTVGNVTNYGIVAPGASPGGMFASNVVMMSGAGVLAVEIAGATADQYDRVNARGIVDVTGGKLWLGLGYAPTEGDDFLIVNNLGAGPVVGTFTGLSEGALLTTNSLAFRLSYTGGDGNDIVLTFTNNTLRYLSAMIRGGNGNNLIDPNECNLLWLTLSNASPTPMMGISATLTPVTPGVAVTYGSSGYPSVGAGVAVANNEPFQIATLPGFICGTNVEFLLAVETTTHGSFSFPITLPSGSVGSAVTYGDVNPRGIPDGGSITSTVSVASFGGPLVKATVDLFISHSYDADLEIFLQAPDGTLVELSTDNGSSGNSYGVSCEATGFKRTRFDDEAAVAITSGTAPFTNAYKPETPLAVLRGHSGAEVNGTWRLIVRDDAVNAFTGALNCWYLTLSGASCTDGGGVCESCPDRTLYGTLSPLSSAHVNYLLRNGIASGCGRAKLCPGSALGNSRRYQAFTFVNGESNACITVALTADRALFSAAYSGTLNPLSLCDNYLADLGAAVSEGVMGSYSFRVNAYDRFVVLVEETAAGSGGNFALSVTGGSCRPALHIRPEGTNQVVLDWTTAAVGYQLERTNTLPVAPNPSWPAMSGIPVVFDGRFQVTNQIPPANRFYRLQKP